MTTPDRLAILGYGRFGRALTELALAADVAVRVLDPAAEVPGGLRATGADELLGSFLGGGGIIVPAVPMQSFRRVLEEIRPHCTAAHTVLDVASVKRSAVQAMGEVLGDEVPWVATHPLFGPMSIGLGERPLRVVVCPDTPHEAAPAVARRFYETLGCLVIEEESDSHDALMARTHVLAFFVAKGLLDIGADRGDVAVPPSFRAMAATVEAVRSDAGHLFFPIQHENPHAARAREELLDALGRIHRELAAEPIETSEAGGAGLRESLAISPSPNPHPELGEMRERIDALDEELVELLARRTRLARHVAKVKSELGVGVQDPGRERQMLDLRRALAEERGLDPGAVEDVFEAVLRFSRGEMRKSLRPGDSR